MVEMAKKWNGAGKMIYETRVTTVPGKPGNLGNPGKTEFFKISPGKPSKQYFQEDVPGKPRKNYSVIIA